MAKGASLSHGNVLANVFQISSWLGSNIVEGKEVVLAALPMYHIFCLVVNAFALFSHGALNVLIPNPRDIKGLASHFHKFHFSYMTGVNTLFSALLTDSSFCSADFSALKFVIGGGAAVKSDVARRWKEVTGKVVLEGYGLTECSPVVSVNVPSLVDFNGTVGMPLPSTVVSVRDDKGEVVPFGEPGELWVKGPQVMQGYWQNVEETNEVLTGDGWFKTGDVATVDEQGLIRIVDRMKDMILVSGFNVYPNEIEEVVMKHPHVVEVACVGVDDDRCGEAVKVFVVGDTAQLSVEDIQLHCRQYLTSYKVPKHVVFCDDLPKSAVGKVLRRELRDA